MIFIIISKVKSACMALVPDTILYRLWNSVIILKSLSTKKKFEESEQYPVWLEWDQLELLHNKYPHPPKYNYDRASRYDRAKKQVGEMLKTIGREINQITKCLELGCGDGISSYILKNIGKIPTAIDVHVEKFEEEVGEAGVTFLQMNANNLEFEDGSFDLVFSCDAFEHFSDPELVLKEAIRVLKKGGYLYLSFGPLYNSPKGLHAYEEITVPYCHFLFPRDLLDKFITFKKKLPISYDQINCWSLKEFRNLFIKHSNKLQIIKYYEKFTPHHLDLIAQYPSCFKSKIQSFDELRVESIKALFRKTH
jgi:ubiquinone/menaquinone biosynthesis C-methylase UbiE